MYICDHHNDRIQKWTQGATTGVTVIGVAAATGAAMIYDPQALTVDKNGYMYVTGHKLHSVVRYPPNSPNGTTIAGTGSTGSALDEFNESRDVIVDDNLNFYVVDMKNNRVMKWAPNATSGTVAISHTSINGVHSMLFAPGSQSQVYLSDQNGNSIYLWTFGASSASSTLTQVNSSNAVLTQPEGIVFDSYNNLYVADSGKNRIVMYCTNKTVGIPVIGESGTTPACTKPMDVAFDSNLNMYVLLDSAQVIKYTRL
ncbi:unnamed protein product [Rotaria sp. Silwood1]|nr:unnamed protein product [Rotaria sp. Silwood1]CAF4636713.1 unnamed protein product [Rotaria sp. Silwood1]